MDINQRIEELKIVPVVVLHDAKDAVPLAQALVDGGLPVAEVTFRTDAAEASIREIAKAFPEMLVGAGTVTSVEQAEKAVAAGARFLVTAGFNRKVTEYAVEYNIPIFPGVCTPTELMFLLEYNLPVAKFFPAAQFGGLATIKALSAPFPNMRFMPTGGINAGCSSPGGNTPSRHGIQGRLAHACPSRIVHRSHLSFRKEMVDDPSGRTD